MGGFTPEDRAYLTAQADQAIARFGEAEMVEMADTVENIVVEYAKLIKGMGVDRTMVPAAVMGAVAQSLEKHRGAWA